MFRRLITAAALAISLAATPTWASTFRDAEAQVAAAYADYRIALYQTNMRNRAATEAALAGFETKWRALAEQWRLAPPPQYVADPGLGATLDRVNEIITLSRAATATGDLARAHVVLEDIRDELWRLRARNGVVVFSDRMNAYHEHMEKVVGGAYGGFSTDGMADLREDVGVLVFLARDVAANPPADIDRAAFDAASAQLLRSVEQLRAAVRRGDVEAIRDARDPLKPPYARMMQRFG